MTAVVLASLIFALVILFWWMIDVKLTYDRVQRLMREVGDLRSSAPRDMILPDGTRYFRVSYPTARPAPDPVPTLPPRDGPRAIHLPPEE